MRKPEKKRGSGIGELLRVGQVSESLPVLQEEDADDIKPGDHKLLSPDDLTERLKFLCDWKASRDRTSMSRTFQTRNFTDGE